MLKISRCPVRSELNTRTSEPRRGAVTLVAVGVAVGEVVTVGVSVRVGDAGGVVASSDLPPCPTNRCTSPQTSLALYRTINEAGAPVVRTTKVQEVGRSVSAMLVGNV